MESVESVADMTVTQALVWPSGRANEYFWIYRRRYASPAAVTRFCARLTDLLVAFSIHAG